MDNVTHAITIRDLEDVAIAASCADSRVAIVYDPPRRYITIEDRRLGRDLGIYLLMARLGGDRLMLVEFAEEALMPLLSQSPRAFRAAVREMVRLGDIVYTPGQAAEFRNALEAE